MGNESLSWLNTFLFITIAASTYANSDLLFQLNGPSSMNETLREAGGRAGVYIGGAHFYKLLFNTSEPEYGQLLKEQFSITTLGNGCKWSRTATAPPPAHLNLSECLQSQRWVQHTMKAQFRLHNLCWGVHNPSWLGPQNSTVLSSLLRAHVTEMIDLAGQFPIVTDVVNEAFCTKSGGTGTGGCFPSDGDLKNGTWYPKLPTYVDDAFKEAAIARDSAGAGAAGGEATLSMEWPRLSLYVNDFGAEAANSTKAQHQLQYVKGMLQRGIPIDGVGLQMHVKPGNVPDPVQVLANMRQLQALGLGTQITEMDVPCPECVPGPAGEQAREQQAKVYGDMLTACLAAKAPQAGAGPGCGGFVTWGFTDKYTDLGPGSYPLPFDAEYQPKEAALELLAVLQHHAAGIRDPTRPWAWRVG